MKKNIAILFAIFFIGFFYFKSMCSTIMPKEILLSSNELIKEIKPVKIRGYKVFNAGVLPIQEGYLFATRKRGESYCNTLWKKFFLQDNIKGLYIGELDKNFKEKNSTGTLYTSLLKDDGTEEQYIDPRLVKIDEQIFMIYCRQINRKTRAESEASLYLAKLEKLDEKWKIVSDVKLTFNQANEFYENKLVQRNFEKNWMPFSKDGKLYFVYLMEPEHIILEANIETGDTIICSRTDNPFPQAFNAPRGSTPAIFDEKSGEWITLYHFVYPSERKYTGRKTEAYFFGAYTFSNDNFMVTKRTNGPINGKNLYNNFHKIIFPTALIQEKDDFLIFYGDDDKTNKVARVSREDLMASLHHCEDKSM